MIETNVGQLWSFQGRDKDTDPKLIIVEKDVIKDIKVVHISVLGVKIKNKQHENGYTDTVGHIPIREDILIGCLINLEGESQIPPIAYQGISTWKEQNGGIWNQPIKDILNFIEDTLETGEKDEEPELYCFEYDYSSCKCEIKNIESPCKGILTKCPFFTVRMKNEVCVLTSSKHHEGEEKDVVESTFFVGEGYEKKGLKDKANESFKIALGHYPDNEFLLNKLGIKKKAFWKFWKKE